MTLGSRLAAILIVSVVGVIAGVRADASADTGADTGSPAPAPRGPDMAAKHTAVFTAPPKGIPTPVMPDGPLLGNGDLGVVLSGPPEEQIFHLGKSDFWHEQPEVEFPKAKIVTVGCVGVSVPAMLGASYRVEQDLLRAEVRGSFRKGTESLELRSWVAADSNLLVIHAAWTGESPTRAVFHAVAGPKGMGDAEREASPFRSSAGCGRDGVWFTRKGSREVAVAARVLREGGGVTTRLAGARAEASFDLEPGRAVTIVVAVRGPSDPADRGNAARRIVEESSAATLETIHEAHLAWWRAFWSRSMIDLADEIVERHWYGALYILGSCSREGRTAPGLWGHWITTDSPSWQGDYTLNGNFESPYYFVHAANHPELAMPYYRAILECLPLGREMARRHGWKGIHLPTHVGPGGILPEGWQDWGQRSNAAYAAVNFIWHYECTLDRNYLETIAYPYLSEVAAFWENYLSLEDGRYCIANDSIHEGSGADFNSVVSLGLVRNVLRAVSSMSLELGVDAERRETWQHILERLAPYPVQVRGGRRVFRYTERGMDWCEGNTLGIQHIFPAGAIGLDSGKGLLELSRETVTLLGRWADFNGFATFYPACARIGYDPAITLRHLREQCLEHALPNLILFYGGGGIETCGGFAAVDEMLLQGHEGVLRVFPSWPTALDAEFERLRAKGAFLVSSRLECGQVTRFVIESEKGRPCTVVSPWKGRAVVVVEETAGGGEVTTRVAEDRVSFETRPGARYSLR